MKASDAKKLTELSLPEIIKKNQEDAEAQEKARATKLNRLIETRIQYITEDIKSKAAKGETYVISLYYEPFSAVARGIAQHFRGLGYNVDIQKCNIGWTISSPNGERESIKVSWGETHSNTALGWLLEKTSKMFSK